MNVQLNPEEVAIVASTHIGIIGGGQLGLMISEAGRAMGYGELTVLDPTAQAPASAVARQIMGGLKDPQALRELAQQSDILTYEIEHINTEALEQLQADGYTIYPSPQILAIIQNKYRQKEFLDQHAIPVAPFRSVESRADIEELARTWGYPLVLKAKKDAYDGRGNARINAPEDIETALAKLAGRELYVEQCLDLKKELGLMIARNARGEISAHPVVEMIHERDICQTVLAPAPIDPRLLEEAQAIAHKAIAHLNAIGIFGVELFLDKAGKLWLNEIAPRPHNLGHYTIEACQTSQFEQHLRAITNLALGDTSMRYPAAVMINILGERNGPAEVRWQKHFDTTCIFVHLYGKRETRVDRKMGHITVVGETLDEVHQLAQEVRASLSI
ncbi:5-(carboxyamino)imidazole ribonucleotide synthase [Ktedonospora formicarum]|uniref:N5-carboxyaminoimidazole ribonucleotide synthase n=1 Tax=Ktedonospora formicarum TaxID=2778364 RepID=A0A8J3MRT7_9CHLR|nr:5-(carboxyamino)imidazole ribonucleotide synthase [Ktedonospora formicarum]GHO44156.1 N5-carboxyaminoimidazole ribonucleotide synthase [Ktedonospora formicarum]